MRILLLSQFFDPEPTLKGLAFASGLARRGHEVEVLTGFPNYPGGRVYPGYRLKPVQRETIEGVRVVRVPLYPSHDSSAVRRSTNYASFAAAAALAGPLLTRKPDVVYAYHPPASIGLPAMAQRFAKRAPIVLDIQDLWPDTLAATGMLSSGPALRAIDWWCRACYRAATRIAVLSPGFKRALIDRGVDAGKIDVVYNWCDESRTFSKRDGVRDLPFDRTGRFVVTFAGTMGFAQGLDVVLDAAKLLAASCPDVMFVLVGGGVDRPRLAAAAIAAQLHNVVFLEPRPMEEIDAVLQASDALLVHLKPHPLFEITIPSKTQAYMAAGRPILMGCNGDARGLVEDAGAGVAFEPGNGTALAGAIMALIRLGPNATRAMGDAGRSFYRRELSMEVGIARFERLFQRAVSGQ